MSFLNYFKKFDKKPPSLLEDPIGQLFVKIAVPSSVGTVFMTLYNVVDTFFAGKISAEALAAIAQTFPVYFIIIAMGVGLSIGTTSLISRHHIRISVQYLNFGWFPGRLRTTTQA